MKNNADVYVNGEYIGEVKNLKLSDNTFKANKFFSAEKIGDKVRINFSEERIKQLIEVVQKAIQEFVENIKAWVKNMMNDKAFQKLLKAVNQEEVEKLNAMIKKRKSLRHSWRQDSYRNKSHSRLMDKRMVCHNCRNNLTRF